MSNFATEFPIDPKNSVADVLRLACDWLEGSPHTELSDSDLQELPDNGERTIKIGIEHVTLAHLRCWRRPKFDPLVRVVPVQI